VVEYAAELAFPPRLPWRHWRRNARRRGKVVGSIGGRGAAWAGIIRRGVDRADVAGLALREFFGVQSAF